MICFKEYFQFIAAYLCTLIKTIYSKISKYKDKKVLKLLDVRKYNEDPKCK